ncbi:MAG: hypothetical protein K8T26_07465 [Lentisphaerae bacterium]|nr:hypothetical protein [Lentisphaerota bacterium]
MPDIAFNCPKCDQELEAPVDFAGQEVVCPGCGAEITVPDSVVAPDKEVDEDLDAEELDEDEADGQDKAEDGVCPECGAEMDPDSVLCLGCGYHARLGRKIQTDFDNS